ncbi:MAG TPA: ABC transporter substrate-binding protein [Solirubrobacteraceae bacterium]|nr:ABC transporter substrate-binding protein [Solirubrobacteraceae bacterium]
MIVASGVAACGDDPDSTAQSTATTAAGAAFPATASDCGGRTATYDKAPQRVFGLAMQGVEMLASLGLTNNVVGYSQNEQVHPWPRYADELAKVPVVGPKAGFPSQEEIVAKSPDFVISPYQSAFAAKNKLPNRLGWKQFGADAYLMSGDCEKEGGTTALDDFDYLVKDTTELGKAFGVQDKAAAVVADYEQRLAAIAERVKGKKSLRIWNYAGEKTPFPSGGPSVTNAIMTLAGTKNVFADIPAAYKEVSFEEVVKRDPQVIWVMPDSGSSIGFIDVASGILEALKTDKRLKDVTAVKNKAYVTISFYAGGIGSPQNMDALESMVKQLEALR